VPEQAAVVVGEVYFQCPAYGTLTAFGQKGWKAHFAIPPALHATDLSYEFHDFGLPATFKNPDFLNAFQGSFLSTALSLDPNVHFAPTITPSWPSWTGQHSEMLFNKTESDAPVVQTLKTDPAVLKRCEFWYEMAAVNSQ